MTNLLATFQRSLCIVVVFSLCTSAYGQLKYVPISQKGKFGVSDWDKNILLPTDYESIQYVPVEYEGDYQNEMVAYFSRNDSILTDYLENGKILISSKPYLNYEKHHELIAATDVDNESLLLYNRYGKRVNNKKYEAIEPIFETDLQALYKLRDIDEKDKIALYDKEKGKFTKVFIEDKWLGVYQKETINDSHYSYIIVSFDNEYTFEILDNEGVLTISYTQNSINEPTYRPPPVALKSSRSKYIEETVQDFIKSNGLESFELQIERIPVLYFSLMNRSESYWQSKLRSDIDFAALVRIDSSYYIAINELENLIEVSNFDEVKIVKPYDQIIFKHQNKYYTRSIVLNPEYKSFTLGEPLLPPSEYITLDNPELHFINKYDTEKKLFVQFNPEDGSFVHYVSDKGKAFSLP